MTSEELSALSPCQNSFHPLMEGDGPDNADLMVVGEAPGEHEDRVGRPFVGASGSFLKKDLLRAAGIDVSKVRFTNAVRCRPPKNRTPTIKEIEKFYPILDEEVRSVRPKVIVVAGSAALASVLRFAYKGSEDRDAKVSGILKWRGKQVWHREWGCWIIPTPHPRYTMTRYRREGSDYHYIEGTKDFELANKLVNQKRPEQDRVESIWVQDIPGLRSMLDEMEATDRFAFDIETGGVGKPADKWIIGASFAANSRVGYYATWDLIESDPRSYERVIELVSSSREKLMHNGAYEISVFRALGLPINTKYFDTMIAANMVDENFDVGLKPLTWVYTSFGGYELLLDKYKYENKIKEDYSLIPTEILAPYGGYDSVATYRLWEVFSQKLKKKRSMSAFSRIVMPVRRTMSDAEYTGIYFDRDRANALSESCDKAKAALEQNVFEAAGREFSINSTQQLGKVLYEEIGLKPLKQTNSGMWSTDAESLEYVASQKNGDIAKYLLDRSYLKTMHSSHIEQALRFVQDDSRVHTSYNLTGTVTGRASCSKPGIHNVPNDSLIRSMYTSSPGNLFADSDLKSAELAYLAAESGEEVFLRAFSEGRDLHSDTYRMIFELPEDFEPTGEQRRFAKCFHPSTEVLTPNGWVQMRDLDGQPIMQAVPGYGGSVSLQWTSEYTCPLEQNHHDKLVTLKNEGIDLTVTPDHRMLVQKSASNKKWSVVTPYEVQKARLWPNAGRMGGGTDISSALVRFIVAIQADGSYSGRKVRFGFTKDRKVTRLKEILADLGADYFVEWEGKWKTKMWYVTVWGDMVGLAKEWLDGKAFSWGLLGASYTARETLVSECEFWDSHRSLKWKQYVYSTSILQNAEVLQAIATSVGRKTRLKPVGEYYRLSVKSTSVSRGGNVSLTETSYTDEVALLSVPSTFVLVRSGGVPVVTGQTINFGLVYGMSQYGLARRLNISVEEAEKFLNMYFDRLPKITEYMNRKKEEAAKNGYVKSLFGGYRHLPLAQSDLDYEQQRAFRQAMNAPIQQGAAFYTYLGLARLRRNIRKRGLEAKIVHTVHDCALVDFPSHEQEAVTETIRDSFEQPLNILPVQMRVETEITKRWGEHNESRLWGILENAGIDLSWIE